MEKEDVETLRKAKSIISIIYFGHVEFENDAVKKDLLNAYGDIEHMCIDSLVTDEVYKGFDESDGDEDKPYTQCEYCGTVIFEDDDKWFAADGSVCCCDECVAEYNKENLPYDDDDDEDYDD